MTQRCYKGALHYVVRGYDKAKAGFEIFWDEARGSYVDHLVDGAQGSEMSQIAGAAAIVSGLAPQERWGRIIETITDPAKLVIYTWQMSGGLFGQGRKPGWDVQTQIVRAEPFMSYLVHDAVALAGKADQLVEIYADWSQFLAGGYDTIGEDWRHGTHVHGWSCTPTKDMVFYTLGVTPAAPGYAAARIAPRLRSLAWAAGKIPTPHGLIHVRAEPGKVEIDSPVPVIIDLPGHAPRRLPARKHVVSA